MDFAERYQSIFDEDEKWSADVKTKEHPPEDLFATGSADDIASWAKKSHGDLKSAMGALNFYLNRAGKNADAKTKAKVNNAKDLLAKKFK